MDDLDRILVEALQADGRLTNQELAVRVGLTHSSVSRRLNRLERDGVITGYRALTNRHRLGLSVRAFCSVVRSASVTWENLAREMAEIEGVVSVFAVSGEADLLLEIVARDMQSYAQVVLRTILEVEGVTATRSSFVLEEMKSLY